MIGFQNGINVFALGGLCEVGKNTYCIESEKSLILLDAGVRFPEATLPGVDYVIPDYTYLKNNRSKIKALFITHGHEDHIGGIPFLVRSVHIPVIYAPKLAAALIRHKLEENRIKDAIKIVEYDSDSIIKVGDDFVVSFFRVTHSIPDSYGICVDTKEGRIVDTGDFKIDLTPVGPTFEISKIAKIGTPIQQMLKLKDTPHQKLMFVMVLRKYSIRLQLELLFPPSLQISTVFNKSLRLQSNIIERSVF